MNYTRQDLLAIVNQYQNQFTSIKNWDAFRRQKKLPHSQTFIAHFGSWNEVKSLAGLPSNKQARPQKFSSEYLLKLLEEHPDKFSSIKRWNEYAAIHSLPGYHVFADRIPSEQLQLYTGKQRTWNRNNLEKVIKEQFPDSPPTVNEWKAAYENNSSLPTNTTIIRKFGSWNQMKYELYYKTSTKRL